MATVFLGIGSNMGHRENNIDAALRFLRDKGIIFLNCSTLIETDPVGGPAGQKKYLNGVVKIKTTLPPFRLLTLLKHIEKKMGRVKTVPNGPRPIDLDILFYDTLHLKTPQLTIPHPRIFERDFVLKPLREIEPDLLKETIHARH